MIVSKVLNYHKVLACTKNTSSDPLICFNYDDFKSFLPITINGVKILKIDWSFFSAQPNF
jgi:hypothetical protein